MGKKRKPLYDISYIEFGEILVNTEDLDPVYSMLVDASLPDDVLKRFMLAYWCYYHCGVAAWIAESTDFYKAMLKGVAGKFPRGMERRYFYSNVALNCISDLEAHGSPESIVDDMCAHRTFMEVNKAVVKYNGFGPWMGWKIADMAERVLCYDVDFSDSSLNIYKDPRKAAAIIVHGDKDIPITDKELAWVCDKMEGEFSHLLAPPWNDRPVNIQEHETILCKTKAHYYGSYPLGNDTYHITKGMRGWGDLSEEMSKHIPIFPYSKYGLDVPKDYLI